MGVTEMIVMMMMEVKTSKHMVLRERQLSRELLLIRTEHRRFYILL
jgi:hypothetical protein